MSCKKAGLLSSCLLVLFLAGALLAGQNSGQWENPPRRNILENGLTWIFQKDDSSELSYLFLLIRGGKSAEPVGKSGLAYLTTRLAIELPDRDKIRDLMVQSTHLFVAGLEDCTLIGVQCLSANFEETMRIVSKILRNPLFSGMRIDSIKENMRNRGKAELDDSVNAGHAEAMQAFFGVEGCGGPVWGTDESLKAIQKKDITHFYDTHFKASNMIMSVASDLDESVISDLVRKHFAGIEPGVRPEALLCAAAAPAVRRINKGKDANQSYLSLSFPLPALSSRNFALAYLAEDVLGGGVGSRLWSLRFRDRLAYNVNSSITYGIGEGLLEAYIETSPGKLTIARESLVRVIQELAATGLNEEDLEISNENASASFLRTNETKEARAKCAALFEARGLGCEFLGKLLDEIRSVGLDELNAYLKEIFSLERAVEIVIGPAK